MLAQQSNLSIEQNQPHMSQQVEFHPLEQPRSQQQSPKRTILHSHHNHQQEQHQQLHIQQPQQQQQQQQHHQHQQQPQRQQQQQQQHGYSSLQQFSTQQSAPMQTPGPQNGARESPQTQVKHAHVRWVYCSYRLICDSWVYQIHRVKGQATLDVKFYSDSWVVYVYL